MRSSTSWSVARNATYQFRQTSPRLSRRRARHRIRRWRRDDSGCAPFSAAWRGQGVPDHGADAVVRAIDHRPAYLEVLTGACAHRRVAVEPRRGSGGLSHRTFALLGAFMLGNLGPMELFIILVIVLVVFGAKRVPEIGASIGRGIREFKWKISDVDRQIREPDREARSERLSEGDAARQEQDQTSEPKRLLR